jgi:hypothetical protein
MVLAAFAVARLLGLGLALPVGFVVLCAVTPDLVTPVMTALASAVLVLVGLGSVALVVAAGFPPASALPAVASGVIELLTSAGLARWVRHGS